MSHSSVDIQMKYLLCGRNQVNFICSALLQITNFPQGASQPVDSVYPLTLFSNKMLSVQLTFCWQTMQFWDKAPLSISVWWRLKYRKHKRQIEKHCKTQLLMCVLFYLEALAWLMVANKLIQSTSVTLLQVTLYGIRCQIEDCVLSTVLSSQGHRTQDWGH